MSLALAMSKIGFYTSKYDLYTSKVNEVQSRLMLLGLEAGQQGQLPHQATNQRERQLLAVYMFLQGLCKEFLDYWKQVVKDFLSMLKSLQELAQGAR